MKNSIILILLFFCVSLTYSQDAIPLVPTPEVDESNKQDKVETAKAGDVIPKDQKISFIAGIGGSYILKDLYQNPVVDLATKNVVLEKAQNFKSNFSLGIAYTGKTMKLRNGNRVPYGWTFITFVNPISFNQSTDNQGFFNMLDFGFGFGHKFAGSMMIVATVNFLTLDNQEIGLLMNMARMTSNI